jgi:hypothetical protein
MGSAHPLVARTKPRRLLDGDLCIGKAAQLQIKAVAHRANDLRRTPRVLAMLLSDQSVKRIVLSLQMSNSPTST